jgi:hypothetical protein
MDRQHKNVRSTKPAPTTEDTNKDFTIPPGPPIIDGKRTHDVIFTVTELPTGKIFTDQMGPFPVVSSLDIKAVMVLYDYDSNSILTEGITSRGQVELLCAYTVLINRLKKAGLTPKLQHLDNKASGIVKNFMTTQQIDYQLTQAGLHRGNAPSNSFPTTSPCHNYPQPTWQPRPWTTSPMPCAIRIPRHHSSHHMHSFCTISNT